MTFDARELSVQDGEPIELYEFQIGPERLSYTNAAEDVTYSARLYRSLSINRGAIEETAELARNDLKIIVPADAGIVSVFDPVPPSEEVACALYGVHRGDTEIATLWLGRVLNVRYLDAGRAELACENIFTSFRRQGLRRLFQRGCPHVLYGNACRVVNTAFRLTDTVTFVDGTTVKAADLALSPDGWYAGGYLEWERTPGRFERRAIRDHIGDTIVMTHRIPALAGGETAFFYPGCAHDTDDCDGKFGNLDNYGGFPHIPGKNPFGQSGAF